MKKEKEIILTNNMLEVFGFQYCGQTITDNSIYRISDEDYPFYIQVVLGDYPRTNPNCGMVYIYRPQEEVYSIPQDLLDKEEWSYEDRVRAENHTVTVDKLEQPIAYYVYNLERLKQVYKALTTKELEPIYE